jgi:hypothetical protein
MRAKVVGIATLVSCAALLAAVTASTQAVDNAAANAPDETAWRLFVQAVTSAGGGNVVFETWASDTDTFRQTPQFPSAPTPVTPRAPVVPAAGRQSIQDAGGLLPQIPPNPDLGEESRRNRPAFDFIVHNKLFLVSGLKAAFGTTISFPVDAIEVKANWMPVEAIPAFTNNRVTLADVPRVYHVNQGSDGKRYAMVSAHVISKLVPNWTWATFEHALNPARCDLLGCIDRFGAQTAVVAPNAQANRGYPACDKTAALTTLMTSAHLDPVFTNYCLKGSQTDFTDNTGLAVRLGNSVTEDGFVNRSSCMTCHGRAAFDRNGKPTSNAGFENGLAPLGPLQPNWYWSFSSSPPIFVGMPGLTRNGTSADFVWSIPFCAFDDTVNPPRPRCVGK